MRQARTPLRGSVTQNTVSARVRVRERDGISFLTRLGLLATFLLVLIGIAVVAWYSGWPQRQALRAQNLALSLSKDAHFEVNDISVEGRNLSSKDALSDALGVTQGMPIFSVNTEEAALRLIKLPWVDTATVQRRLPDTIAVSITERVPKARWQNDGKFYVIDARGRVLPTVNANDFPDLPLVVGAGAQREAQSLFSALKKHPDISEKIGSAVRVGERRWDLHLKPKLVVKLPEDDVETALHRLSVQIQENILQRDIVTLDLRIIDRLVMEPAEVKQTGDSHP